MLAFEHLEYFTIFMRLWHVGQYLAIGRNIFILERNLLSKHGRNNLY